MQALQPISSTTEFVLSIAGRIRGTIEMIIVGSLIIVRIVILELRLGQCIAEAEMVAAQIFNRNQERPLAEIYVVISMGTVWKCLVLKDNLILIDSQEYYINKVNNVLAIMLLSIKKFLVSYY